MIKSCYKFSTLLLSFFSLYLLYGCETVPVRQEPIPGSPAANAPKMVVGDSWTFRERTYRHGKDVLTDKIIKVESDGSYSVEKVRKKKNRRWTMSYNKMSRLINRQDKWFYLNFPLFVGKKWENKYNAKSISGINYDYVNQYMVKKYEKVDTDAGNFDAFKISVRYFNPEMSGVWSSVYWYSPEIKKIVKFKSNWTRGYELDLISYKLATDEIAKLSVQKKITPQPEKSEQQKVVTGTDKPKVIIESERVKVGIIEFQNLNEEARKDNLGKVVSEMLTTAFVSSEAFKIIEREQLQKIIKEFKLSQSGIIDTSDAKKIGKIAGATSIVTGSVVKMRDYIRLDARIIDVESGIILIADKNEGPAGIKSIGAMVDQIVSNFVSKFYMEKK